MHNQEAPAQAAIRSGVGLRHEVFRFSGNSGFEGSQQRAAMSRPGKYLQRGIPCVPVEHYFIYHRYFW